MDLKEAPIVEVCPGCGRPMSIRLERIGKPIRCGHCGCDCLVQVDGPFRGGERGCLALSSQPIEVALAHKMIEATRA